MTARRPIVRVGGRFQQLPAGDTLDVPAEWDALKAPTIASSALIIDLATPAGFRVALNQNVSTLSFANVPTGRVVVFTITWVQDATGGRTVAFPASVKADGGGAPVQPTAGANAATVQSFYTDDGGVTVWQAGGLDPAVLNRISALESRELALGSGQKWRAVSKLTNTTYTNSSGRSIYIVPCIITSSSTGFLMRCDITNPDGSVETIHGNWQAAGTLYSSLFLTIPAGAKYSVYASSGSSTVYAWRELSA